MAILPIKKIHILGHKSIKKELIDLLYERGVVEILQSPDNTGTEINHENSAVSDTDIILSRIEYSIKFLEKYAAEKSPEFLKKECSTRSENILPEDIYNFCKKKEEEISALTQKKEKNIKLISDLLPWKNLETPLNRIRGTETAGILCGKIASKNLKHLIENLKDGIAETVYDNGKIAYIAILYSREQQESVENIARDNGFSAFSFPDSDSNLTVSDQLKNLECEIVSLESLHKSLLKEIKNKYYLADMLKAEYNKYLNLKIKNLAYEYLSNTEETFYLCGWIVEKNIKRLKEEIEQKYSEAEIFFTDPSQEDNIPVFLGNNRVVDPFTGVTEMYGYPAYNGIDATPLLAPFFALSFGLCMCDGFYGILLAAGAIFVIKKKSKGMSQTSMRFFKMIFLCGIATIFWGAITGGWMGDIIDRLPGSFLFLKNFKENFVINQINPSENPLNFLILSLILGTIQIVFAISINFYYQLRIGNKFFAFFQQLPTITIHLLLLAVILSIAGVLPSGKNILNIYAILFTCSLLSVAYAQWRINNNIVDKLFWAVFSNYNIITGNFLSDTLSYARLFALGLSGSLMAVAINEISLMTMSLPYYLGIIPMLLFLAVGHIFNIAINVLGAYVHTSRLQYLEFFSKFYVSGGKVFKPFGATGKYMPESG